MTLKLKLSKYCQSFFNQYHEAQASVFHHNIFQRCNTPSHRWFCLRNRRAIHILKSTTFLLLLLLFCMVVFFPCTKTPSPFTKVIKLEVTCRKQRQVRWRNIRDGVRTRQSQHIRLPPNPVYKKYLSKNLLSTSIDIFTWFTISAHLQKDAFMQKFVGGFFFAPGVFFFWGRSRPWANTRLVSLL